jgi:hypothetical protein
VSDSFLLSARELPPDHPDLRRSRCMTLLRVRDGRAVFANTMRGKDSLLAELQGTDAVLVAWTGRYKTDIFAVSQDELRSKMTQETA